MQLIKSALITLTLLSAVSMNVHAVEANAKKAVDIAATKSVKPTKLVKPTKPVKPIDKLVGTPITYDAGIQYQIHSSILAEDRQLLIHLPEGYEDSETRYPVIYVLDGKGHFRHATTAVTLLESHDMMPQSIIVAIPNNRGTRSRDLGKG